jgi:hypothetical protein
MKIETFSNKHDLFIRDEYCFVTKQQVFFIFSLELCISKLIQRDALIYEHPEHGEIGRLKRFPCGMSNISN